MTGATLVVESPSPPPRTRTAARESVSVPCSFVGDISSFDIRSTNRISQRQEQEQSVCRSTSTFNTTNKRRLEQQCPVGGGVFLSQKDDQEEELRCEGWSMEHQRVPLVDHTQHTGGQQQQQQQKRTRRLFGCGGGDSVGASTSSFGVTTATTNNNSVQHKESVVKALRALFPTVGDEVIGGVLEEHGEDVDGAIRRLHDEVARHGMRDVVVEEVDNNDTDCSGRECRSKEEWLDVLVQEMAVAKDVEDAKGRAAKVLDSIIACVHMSGGGGVTSNEDNNNNDSMLVKENALLKRAVGIQNSKLHEMNERCREFDSVVGRYQELEKKCHALEMHNYSLQLHLKQATESQFGSASVYHHHPFGGGGAGGGGAPHPDVF